MTELKDKNKEIYKKMHAPYVIHTNVIYKRILFLTLKEH